MGWIWVDLPELQDCLTNRLPSSRLSGALADQCGLLSDQSWNVLHFMGAVKSQRQPVIDHPMSFIGALRHTILSAKPEAASAGQPLHEAHAVSWKGAC